MASIECLAKQWLGAKEKKAEIDRYIQRIEREILDSKEATELLRPIHNEGGEKTKDGITVAISRTHVWDQAQIDELLEAKPQSEWPSFVSQHTSYKVDMRSFQTYAMNHPKDAGKWHDAHSIKLGDPKVKTIKAENIKEA